MLKNKIKYSQHLSKRSLFQHLVILWSRGAETSRILAFLCINRLVKKNKILYKKGIKVSNYIHLTLSTTVSNLLVEICYSDKKKSSSAFMKYVKNYRDLRFMMSKRYLKNNQLLFFHWMFFEFNDCSECKPGPNTFLMALPLTM